MIRAAIALVWLVLTGATPASGHMPSAAPPVVRADGSRIAWYLDRRAHGGRQGILVLAQGSGCASVTVNHNIALAKRRLLPSFAVVTLDKYGVKAGDDPRSDTDDCSQDFVRHFTIGQWVEDFRAVIARAERSSWWNGKLVLFGGSEGGAAMQLLAPHVHPAASVIVSSATGLPFRDAFVQVLPPDLAAEAPAQLAAVRRAPDSNARWLGNSYRWWADIMDRRLSDDALRVTSPLLVVQGAADRSNPVTSARAFRDAFRTAHHTNLTYLEYAAYDHAMNDSAGRSHLGEVLTRIEQWLERQTTRQTQSTNDTNGHDCVCCNCEGA